MDVEKISVDGFNLNVSDAKARDMISDKYDPDNGTYVVGDTCINDDILYICNTDIDTPEDFDSSKWDADTVGHYCTELKSNLTDLMDITRWNHQSVSLTPTTADSSYKNTTISDLKSSHIVVLQAGDLQAVFYNTGRNCVQTFNFRYSLSTLTRYDTGVHLHVDFTNGQVGIRQGYKATDGSYSTLTDVYWI